MRAVIIDTNTNLVINVIELDEDADYTPPTGQSLQFSDEAQIGWSWNGSVFTPPIEPPAPVVVPYDITTRQFLIAAALGGIITQQEAIDAATTGAVPAAIQVVFDQLPEEQAFAAQITWAKMTTIPRVDPLVEAVGAMFGMTDEELDQFFIDASQI